MNIRSIVFLALALSTLPLQAEDTPVPVPTAPEPATPCSEAAYADFDFWLGRWEVRNPQGQVVGYNRVARDYGGCVIRESYRGKDGFLGESLNTFDPGRGVWVQTWMDNQGTLLQLQGGLRGPSMILSGDIIRDGQSIAQRIRWTPLPDGGVRQLWERRLSPDAQWDTVFDGWYRKVSAMPDGAETF